jgi:hypothetical protein
MGETLWRYHLCPDLTPLSSLSADSKGWSSRRMLSWIEQLEQLEDLELFFGGDR